MNNFFIFDERAYARAVLPLCTAEGIQVAVGDLCSWRKKRLPYLDGWGQPHGREAVPQHRWSFDLLPYAAPSSPSTTTTRIDVKSSRHLCVTDIWHVQLHRPRSLTLSGSCTLAPRSSSSVTDSMAPTAAADDSTLLPVWKKCTSHLYLYPFCSIRNSVAPHVNRKAEWISIIDCLIGSDSHDVRPCLPPPARHYRVSIIHSSAHVQQQCDKLRIRVVNQYRCVSSLIERKHSNIISEDSSGHKDSMHSTRSTNLPTPLTHFLQWISAPLSIRSLAIRGVVFIIKAVFPNWICMKKGSITSYIIRVTDDTLGQQCPR